MDEVIIECFFGVALVTHQTVLFDSDHYRIFAYLWDFLAVFVSLDPYYVLASLEAPLFEQLPRVFEVLCACPKEDEGGTIADLTNVDLLQLLQWHR